MSKSETEGKLVPTFVSVPKVASFEAKLLISSMVDDKIKITGGRKNESTEKSDYNQDARCHAV